MKHTLKTSVLFLVLIVSINTHAQQDPQYTHNMFDRLSINPASAGMSGSYCATTILRQQWTGFDGAPKTGLLNLQMPFKPAHGGFGLSFNKDVLGQENNTMLRLSYSYHIALPNGSKLGLGASGGMFNKRLGGNWIANDPSDPTITYATTSSTIFNTTAGIYYSMPGKMYAGISSTNLLQDSFPNQSITSARHYYLMAGYNFEVPGMPQLQLQPSILAKSDASATTIDLNVIGVLNNKFYAGVTYRHDDAVAPLAGIMLQPKANHWLRIGYSYDITTSELRTVSSGTHEVMVSYCFKIPPAFTKHRDTRFMGTSPFMVQ